MNKPILHVHESLVYTLRAQGLRVGSLLVNVWGQMSYSLDGGVQIRVRPNGDLEVRTDREAGSRVKKPADFFIRTEGFRVQKAAARVADFVSRCYEYHKRCAEERDTGQQQAAYRAQIREEGETWAQECTKDTAFQLQRLPSGRWRVGRGRAISQEGLRTWLRRLYEEAHNMEPEEREDAPPDSKRAPSHM